MKFRYFSAAAALSAAVLLSGCGTSADESANTTAVSTTITAEETAEQVLTVDFTEQGMNINGETIGIPVEMDVLTELLGEPRATEYQTDLEDIPDYMLEEFPEMALKRINYTWDELGIYCYTTEGQPVNCIGVMVNKNLDVEHYPEKMFDGEMTICGEPWYEVMRNGTDLELFRTVTLGDYMLLSEHTDIYAIEASHSAADYVGIEFQLE